MGVLSKFKKTLHKEFPAFHPDLVHAIVRFVSGARTHETFKQFSDRITQDMSFDSDEEKQNFIDNVVLEMSRNVCNDSEIVALLQQTLKESIEEIKAEKEASTFQHATAVYSPGIHKSGKKRKSQSSDTEPEQKVAAATTAKSGHKSPTKW